MPSWSLRILLVTSLAVGISTMSGPRDLSAKDIEPEPRLRRPTALALSDDEQWLYVGNRLTGTVSVIDLSRQAVVHEMSVATQLSDMRLVEQQQRLVATDEATHELVLITIDGARLSITQRIKVSPYPVSVAISQDGQRAIVASLWSRRLSFVELAMGTESPARITHVVDLPFAPRSQLLVKGDTQLIVADAFGGRIAIVDMATAQLQHVREFPGHNIRGMGVSANGEMLIVAHQMLNELAHTVRNDVHWGLLMSNDLRWLRLDAVLQAESDLYDGAHMHPLGQAGSATGDPAGIVVTARGSVVVALGGVGEIAIGKEEDFSLNRIVVGQRPTALEADRAAARIFVANTFDDSIAIVDVAQRETVASISLGTQRELTLAERGELLFYDASLSHDSWMSCHSCHTDGHSNGLLNDNFSDASFGAPKRVLSLLGSVSTAPFAWAGTAATLEAQIEKSLTHTMQTDEPPTAEQLEALAAYVESLTPPPSIDVARGVQDHEAVVRGRQLFEALECVGCHKPPVYTTPDTYDVGLDDKQGNRKFNPPTLLGVGQRGPYFHDNRAASLEAVFVEFQHQLERELSAIELSDLLSFLRSL